MGKLRKTIFTLWLLALSLTAAAARQGKETVRMFARWQSTPDTVLIDNGRKFMLEGKIHDALVVNSIVANRSYRPDASADEYANAARALNNIGYIYFYHYFDYVQAFSNLQRAQRLAEQYKQTKCLAYVYLNLGNLYRVMSGVQPHDKYFARKPLEFYRRAFNCAYKSSAFNVMQTIYNNMLAVAYTNGNMKAIAKERQLYHSLNFATDMPLTRYNAATEKAFLALAAHRYADAISYARAASDAIDIEDSPQRYRFSAIGLQLNAYEMAGDHQAWLQKVGEMTQLVNRYDLRDLKVEVYRRVASYYRHAGQRDSTTHYELLYFKAKDQLFNESRLQAAGEMHFLTELQDANDKVRILASQHRQQQIIIALCIVIALLAIVSLVYFVRKNRDLRRRQQALYEHMQESLRRDDEERDSQQHATAATTQRYAGSKLAEEKKREIYDSVRRVMTDTDTICSPDFTLRLLAEKTGHAYAELSQTINEMAGKNFNSLLGEYRIREACRRLGDADNYGNLTIEAIAASVGFKSRTNFVAIFKKVTGLTPSEYQRTARLQNATNHT